MNKLQRNIIWAIAFFILGLAMTLQFRSTLYDNWVRAQSALSMEQVKAQLAEVKAREAAISKQIRDNERLKEEYIQADIALKKDKSLKNLKQELDRATLAAGLSDVRGNGVIVRMDDAPAMTPYEEPSEIIIHDKDVVGVINNLRASGAQALSVNGERIITISELVCAGPTIRINYNRYAVPYIIYAIGDADKLYENLTNSDIAMTLRDLSIALEVTKAQNLLIPKYDGNVDHIISSLEVSSQ